MIDKKQLIVWDLFVRIFHWSLVLFISLAYVTGDSKGPLHKYIGFVVLGLVVSRIFWGFYVTKHALFIHFMCPPGKALTYLKELAIGNPAYYKGHNPAAAWMIILSLISSIIICLSGYGVCATTGKPHSAVFKDLFSFVVSTQSDDEKNERYEVKHQRRGRHNFGERRDSDRNSVWSDFHKMAAQFMLILIYLHIIGVILSSKIHKENLVKSMITGIK